MTLTGIVTTGEIYLILSGSLLPSWRVDLVLFFKGKGLLKVVTKLSLEVLIFFRFLVFQTVTSINERSYFIFVFHGKTDIQIDRRQKFVNWDRHCFFVRRREVINKNRNSENRDRLSLDCQAGRFMWLPRPRLCFIADELWTSSVLLVKGGGEEKVTELAETSGTKRRIGFSNVLGTWVQSSCQ